MTARPARTPPAGDMLADIEDAMCGVGPSGPAVMPRNAAGEALHLAIEGRLCRPVVIADGATSHQALLVLRIRQPHGLPVLAVYPVPPDEMTNLRDLVERHGAGSYALVLGRGLAVEHDGSDQLLRLQYCDAVSLMDSRGVAICFAHLTPDAAPPSSTSSPVTATA